MEPASLFSFVSAMIKLAMMIATVAKKARQNQTKCMELSDRARRVAGILSSYKPAATGEAAATQDMLGSLNEALDEAHKLVKSCCGDGQMYRLVGSRAVDAKLDSVNNKISNCLTDLIAIFVVVDRNHHPASNSNAGVREDKMTSHQHVAPGYSRPNNSERMKQNTAGIMFGNHTASDHGRRLNSSVRSLRVMNPALSHHQLANNSAWWKQSEINTGGIRTASDRGSSNYSVRSLGESSSAKSSSGRSWTEINSANSSIVRSRTKISSAHSSIVRSQTEINSNRSSINSVREISSAKSIHKEKIDPLLAHSHHHANNSVRVSYTCKNGNKSVQQNGVNSRNSMRSEKASTVATARPPLQGSCSDAGVACYPNEQGQGYALYQYSIEDDPTSCAVM
uniref:Mixed lineage kinase domain-containing protein n=1 Tax=Oryza barthii TaxID=65489 RepID=A0A0D3HPN8_9ORYZ